MDVISLNTLFVIGFFIPGYIFINTKDYFLLKCRKTQFEKTVQGLIASLVLWGVFILIKTQPLNQKKESILNVIFLYISKKENASLEYLIDNRNTIIIFLLLLCLYSFIISVIYSLIRKSHLVSNIIQIITSRDYFERVKFRFFSEGINKTVIITMKMESVILEY